MTKIFIFSILFVTLPFSLVSQEVKFFEVETAPGYLSNCFFVDDYNFVYMIYHNYDNPSQQRSPKIFSENYITLDYSLIEPVFDPINYRAGQAYVSGGTKGEFYLIPNDRSLKPIGDKFYRFRKEDNYEPQEFDYKLDSSKADPLFAHSIRPSSILMYAKANLQIPNWKDIYFSTNNGQNWNKIFPELKLQIWNSSFDHTTDEIAILSYSSTEQVDIGIVYSLDKGENWGFLKLPSSIFFTDASVGLHNGIFYLFSSNTRNLYISKDGGTTWELEINRLPGNEPIRQLYVDGDVLYLKASVYQDAAIYSYNLKNKSLMYVNYYNLVPKPFGNFISDNLRLYFTENYVFSVVYYPVSGVVQIKKSTFTSVEENRDNFSIGISPNPASDLVTLDLGSNTSGQLSILSTTGTELFSKNIENGMTEKLIFNLSDYPPGVYFAVLTTPTGTHSQKFVKI